MIVEYNEEYKRLWDNFVLNESINGNFLQTRNFLDYHPIDRYVDASVLFMKDGKLAAVIPANYIEERNSIIAHQGTTYGGLVIGKNYANTKGYDWIFGEMIQHFMNKSYKKAELKTHNWLYSPVKEHHELLDYYYQLNGFTTRSEVGFYIDLNNIDDNYTDRFEKLKRRKLNKANKVGLTFRKLSTDEEVISFYDVLLDNMKKFNTVPIHTIEELLDFKNHRLRGVTSFYGVFLEDKLIAGSMVWDFCDKKVFHTQYLASHHEYLDLCPNEYLYSNLIQAAREEGWSYLSYGTASLDEGRIYNESLGMFKEGFNTDSYLNRCYIWEV